MAYRFSNDTPIKVVQAADGRIVKSVERLRPPFDEHFEDFESQYPFDDIEPGYYDGSISRALAAEQEGRRQLLDRMT